MDEELALRRSRGVGVGSLAIGTAMLLFPRRIGQIAGLTVGDARLIALGDLAVGPGLIWARPRRPWLLARGGVNLGIAALLLRRGTRPGRAIAAGLGFVTVLDLQMATAFGDAAAADPAEDGAVERPSG